MDAVECKNIIFSSSATVYGNPQYLPIDEKIPCKPTNTYGITKFMIEEIICKNNNKNKCYFRYFNYWKCFWINWREPFGTPNNLMPYITQETFR